MISVIIPSRDRESYINDLIGDLINQVHGPLEIIVVDQSDKPYNNLDCIHIADPGGLGPCRARNLGLEAASGEVLVFLDDDIRIAPDFLNHLCSPILNRESMAVTGAICDEAGIYPNIKNPYWKKETKNWLLSITANLEFPGRCPTLSFASGCSAIHRTVYEAIGGFDPYFDPDGAGEDREYGLRIFHAGFSILFEGKAAVRHLAAPGGGRRNTASGFKYLNILEANSVYIVAKYFNMHIFNAFCDEWLKSILGKRLGINPRAWRYAILSLQEARTHSSRIRKIKIENGW